MLDGTYSPMTIRFFILQAHYRSTLDFSNEALHASQKGLEKLLKAMVLIDTIKPGDISTLPVEPIIFKCDEAIRDDMNTPVLIAHLFDGIKMIRSLADKKDSITAADLNQLKSLYQTMVHEILGIIPTREQEDQNNLTGDLMEMIISLRNEAKTEKDFNTADKIRNELTRLGITLKDHKEGTDWEIS